MADRSLGRAGPPRPDGPRDALRIALAPEVAKATALTALLPEAGRTAMAKLAGSAAQHDAALIRIRARGPEANAVLEGGLSSRSLCRTGVAFSEVNKLGSSRPGSRGSLCRTRRVPSPEPLQRCAHRR